MKGAVMQGIFWLWIFTSFPAIANPPYVPKNFPNCVKMFDSVRGISCSYTLDSLKKVYKADAALTALKKQNPLLDHKIKSLNKVIKNQNLQIELVQSSVDLFLKRNRELTSQLLKTDRALQEEKARPNWGNYLLWGVVIALTAGFVSYVIADVTSNAITKERVPTHP